jgi:hypothetical protein
MKLQIRNILKKLGFQLEPSKWNAAKILNLIVESASSTINELSLTASRLYGTKPETAYKGIYRYLHNNNPVEYLPIFAPENPQYVIMDITPIERPQAEKTEYVGYVKVPDRDKPVRGYELIVAGPVYKKRVIPTVLKVVSSRLIKEKGISKNQMIMEAIEEIHNLYPNSIIILDRGFASQNIIGFLLSRGLKFIIRINQGTSITVGEQKIILGEIEPGKMEIYRSALYVGKLRVHIVGYRPSITRETMWFAVSDGVDVHSAVDVYYERFYIEHGFKDLKSRFNLHRAMIRSVRILERLIALILIAYILALVAGSFIREKGFIPKRYASRYSSVSVFYRFSHWVPPDKRQLLLQSILSFFQNLPSFNNPHDVQFHVRK